MTLEEATRILESKQWKFARTMPWVPHYYSLKVQWADPEQFVAAVQAIEDHGVPMLWGKKPAKKYLDIGEWRYWHMSSSQEATLINRELIEKSKARPVEAAPSAI